jgi:hypothetical protein
MSASTSTITPCFDTTQCENTNILASYKTVCNGSESCIQKLQQFCKTQIHTEPELKAHNTLITCHMNCGSDMKCKQQCATK